jgi:tRNA(Ile)-lysidine synthase
LLQVRRAELRDYLKARAQDWREDPSNRDVTRLRARFRHTILPVLERELQPAIVEHLGRVARLAREDESFWSVLVAERINALTRRDNDRIGIRRDDLLAPASFLPASAVEAQRALSQRMVRGIVAGLSGPPRQLTERHVAQVLHVAEKSQSGHRTEIPRAMAERDFDWIWFAPASEAAAQEAATSGLESKRVSSQTSDFERVVRLGAAGEETAVAVPEIGRRISLKVIDWPPKASETSLGDASMDVALLQAPLLLRNWRPGDCFRPQGRRHSLKLKQFLRERRVALRDRRAWPVLTSAGSVVWTRGLPAAVEVVPGRMTRAAVMIADEAL